MNKIILLGIVVGIGSCLLFLLAGAYPGTLESFYSRNIYFWILGPVHFLSSLFPFSLTDFSFLAIPVVIGVVFWRFGLMASLSCVGAFYALFLLLWGFNYGRLDLETTLQVPKKVDPDVLKKQLNNAAKITNELRKQISPEKTCFDFPEPLEIMDSLVLSDQKRLFSKMHLPFKEGRAKKRMLSSFWIQLSNSGIYGPFTAEINIVTPLAPGLSPFILAHERNHLNGFASETDANILAFLSLWSSTNPRHRYSGWLAFWGYVRERTGLSELVQTDLKCIRDFYKEHESPGLRGLHGLYDFYLKLQGQKRGSKTYADAAEVLARQFAAKGIDSSMEGYGLVGF